MASNVSGAKLWGDGGGIHDGGTLNVTDCTIANNEARGFGGGIDTTGTATLNNTVVAANTLDDISTFTYGGNQSGGVVSPSSAFNLIGTGGSGGLVNGVNGNQVGVVNPGLGSLTDNGGPTLTMALLPGSPAIDAGSNGLIPPGVQYDQRGPGFQRIVNGTVDIGAFEWQPYVSSSVVSWGTQTAPLKTAADGLRVLPVGRNTDLPWLNINSMTVSLSTAETLRPADITVSSASGTTYGPVTLSGSGTNYTITLAKPISQADRVTFTINLGGMVTSTMELDVLPGDVNDDGVVNAQDLVLIRNAIQNTGDPLIISWVDLDGNGVIDIKDFIAARSKLGSRLPKA